MALPSGYTQLEYIQSSGTQYIDTGFKPNQDTRVVVKAKYTQPSTATYLFGADAGSGKAGFSFGSANGNLRQFYNTTSTYFDSGLSFTEPITIDANKNVCSIDSSYTVTGTYATFNPGYSMYLFAANRAGSVYGICTATVYSCKIYDNGTLVRDLVPAKNSSGAAGLYDTVHNIFYANAGSGVIVAGPEVETDSTTPKGKHNTLIDGTAYEIKGGKGLVGGTVYDVKKGRTLVNGTGYDIAFDSGLLKVTITGEGTNNNLVYVTVNGVKYYQDTEFEVEPGAELYCYLQMPNLVGPSGSIYLNGTEIKSAIHNETITYTHNIQTKTSVVIVPSGWNWSISITTE